MIGVPGWTMLLSVLLVALGMWFVLRGRILVWLLVVLIVVVAPVGRTVLATVSAVIYALVVYEP